MKVLVELAAFQAAIEKCYSVIGKKLSVFVPRILLEADDGGNFTITGISSDTNICIKVPAVVTNKGSFIIYIDDIYTPTKWWFGESVMIECDDLPVFTLYKDDNFKEPSGMLQVRRLDDNGWLLDPITDPDISIPVDSLELKNAVSATTHCLSEKKGGICSVYHLEMIEDGAQLRVSTTDQTRGAVYGELFKPSSAKLAISAWFLNVASKIMDGTILIKKKDSTFEMENRTTRIITTGTDIAFTGKIVEMCQNNHPGKCVAKCTANKNEFVRMVKAIAYTTDEDAESFKSNNPAYIRFKGNKLIVESGPRSLQGRMVTDCVSSGSSEIVVKSSSLLSALRNCSGEKVTLYIGELMNQNILLFFDEEKQVSDFILPLHS